VSGVESPSVSTVAPRRLALQAALAKQTAQADEDYWSFRDAARARADDAVMFQYPAMMVSPMQGALIDVLAEHRERLESVLDPFVGSGTTLIESMRRGLSFTGSDLNPLAVMLARVESAEAAAFDIERSLAAVLRGYGRRRGRSKPPAEMWIARWYRADVAAQLAALRASIRREPEPALRRLWWACLAEVARVSSDARLSTPKLQHRPAPDLAREIDVRERFQAVAERAAAQLGRRAEAMRAAGHLRGRRYRPGLQLRLADARELPKAAQRADLILTSPPYGDNHTTMPYGQASFLALCWIDLADIGSPIPAELLASSRALDTASLGGSRRTAEAAQARELTARSPALGAVLADLEERSREAWLRVAAFFIDYDRAWTSILAAAAADAHLVVTLGDRTVRGREVPTAQITHDLLAARGVVLVERLHRRIPHNKRLARRNEVAETISTETVLIMQRG
jgi:hypothetical protein